MGPRKKEIITKELNELSDREVNERIALELVESNLLKKRILDNVLFFFWATIIFAVAFIFSALTLFDVLKRLN